MDRKQHGALELFARVHAFLQANKPQGEVASIDSAVASLGEVLAALREQQRLQATLARTAREQTVVRVQRTRRLTVGLMRPIARMAKVLYPNDDALLPALHVPAGGRTEELVGAATSMAEVLRPRLARFQEAGLATDVLERLEEAATALRELATARALDQARRAAAAEGIRQEVQRGQVILRLLDALVRLPLEGDVAQRAEWKSLMRRARQNGGREAGSVDAGANGPPEAGTLTPALTPAAPAAVVAVVAPVAVVEGPVAEPGPRREAA